MQSDPNYAASRFGMAAAKIAVKDANLDVTKITAKDRFGVLIGSGTGAAEFLEDSCHNFFKAGGGKAGLAAVSPLLIPNLVSNTACAIVAQEMGAKGPNYGAVSACATGTHCIGDALYFLQSGQVSCLAWASSATYTTLLVHHRARADDSSSTTGRRDPCGGS